jgi:hypothetical protein
MKKVAFLVFGPESSGTRMVTSAFIAAGCAGCDTHGQKFDRSGPEGDLIVWRRSFPHGDQWPDAVKMIEELRDDGYRVRVVVTTRDWYCLAASQVERCHSCNTRTAVKAIQTAYQKIFAAIAASEADFTMVSYESLAQRPKEGVAGLMRLVGLHAVEIDIVDGNDKHFQAGGQSCV